MKLSRLYLLLALACVFSSLSQANDVEVFASFVPDRVQVGDDVSYVITVLNASTSLSLPREALRIDGLRFRRQSSRRNMSNQSGKMTIESISDYSFIAEKEGRYRMPAFQISLDGKTIQVNEAVLLVEESTSPNAGDQVDDMILQYEIPESIYAGQVFPVTLNLLIKRGIEYQLQEAPVMTGTAFTQPEMPNRVEEGRTRVGDTVYSVITIKFLTTALQSGEQEFRFDWRVGRVANSTRGRSRDIFDQFFQGRELRAVSVASEQQRIEVLPLPTEGRPESFDGAIGIFSIAQDEIVSQAQAGQAVSMKIKVKGKGNFTGMPAPRLDLGDGWKTYEPTEEFIDEDGTSEDFGYQGTKVFEYLLIPESEQVTQTPAVQFSFFSPEDGEYIETNLPSLPITVIPAISSAVVPAREDAAAGRSNSVDQGTVAQAEPSASRQIILYEELPMLPTTFLVYTAIYWQVNALIFILLVGVGICLFVIRRKRNDPFYQRKKEVRKKISFYREQARRVVEQGESERVFSSARLAICERVTIASQVDPLSLTFAEAEDLLNEDQSFSDSDKEIVRTVLDLSEKSRYGKQAINSKEYQKELDTLWKVL